MEAEMRIQRRHRHVAHFGDWAGSIDGTSGMDTYPDSEFVDDGGSGFTGLDVPPDGSAPTGGSSFLDVP
jgi:hypothetical protein